MGFDLQEEVGGNETKEGKEGGSGVREGRREGRREE